MIPATYVLLLFSSRSKRCWKCSSSLFVLSFVPISVTTISMSHTWLVFFHLNFAPILPRSSWPHPHTTKPRHYQWTCPIYNMTIFIDLLSVSVDRFNLKFWNFNWSVTLAYLSNATIQSKSCNTTVRNYTNWRWYSCQGRRQQFSLWIKRDRSPFCRVLAKSTNDAFSSIFANGWKIVLFFHQNNRVFASTTQRQRDSCSFSSTSAPVFCNKPLLSSSTWISPRHSINSGMTVYFTNCTEWTVHKN